MSRLRPGVNRVVIQAFDATDTEIDRASVDVWYNTGSMVAKSGTLAADEVWTAAGGPYQVTATVTVPAGRTLTIEPGTTVFFEPSAGLIVQGRLVAVGSDYERIRFNQIPGQDHWQSISFLNSDQDNRLMYVDVEFGGNQSRENGHRAFPDRDGPCDLRRDIDDGDGTDASASGDPEHGVSVGRASRTDSRDGP